VEVLGVLDNLGPKQSVILARLSGGPLERTGVMQGMSGSPVYIDGRLVGAVALAFSFSKEPIAGIRPIEEMQAVGRGRSFPAQAPARAALNMGEGKLIEIATPVSFSGFTSTTLDQFAPQLRTLGLEPRQGVSSGGQLPQKLGNPDQLRPGDMITVQLLSGDLSIGAEGTVTDVDGSHILAFGHRFMSVGDTELPFARADVIALLPNLSTSFKISSAREWMGTILQDRSASIYGEVGRKAATAPLTITLHGARGTTSIYHMETVNDRLLTPFILQMALFSSIDATERTLGLGSFTVRGSVDFDGLPSLKLDNSWSGDFNVPLQAATGISVPLAAMLTSGFDGLRIKNISIDIDAAEKKRVLQIDQVTPSRREVRPGETIELMVTLAGENGAEVQKTARYTVPEGGPAGTLQITVADASSTNMLDLQQLASSPAKSPSQLIGFLNGLRPNTKAYARIWRSDPAYQVQGQDLPDPPPSLALILAKAQGSPQTLNLTLHGSKVAELDLDAGDYVVTGSKTVQVEVKE
jgi:SpoIVB peptidase S55